MPPGYRGVGMTVDEVKPLTSDEVKGIREMYDHYRTGRTLGRLFWKITVAIGAAIAGLAAAKDQLIAIFSKGP